VPISVEDDHVVVDVEIESDVVVAVVVVVVVDTMDSEEGLGTVSDVEVDMETEGEEDVKVDALLVTPEGRVVEDPAAMMSHPSYSAPEGATRTICVKTRLSALNVGGIDFVHRWIRLGKGPPETTAPRPGSMEYRCIFCKQSVGKETEGGRVTYEVVTPSSRGTRYHVRGSAADLIDWSEAIEA
jgi:hypothetical protein